MISFAAAHELMGRALYGIVAEFAQLRFYTIRETRLVALGCARRQVRTRPHAGHIHN